MPLSYDRQKEHIAELVQSQLALKKANGEVIDPSHDWFPHLNNVSQLAPVFAQKLGYSEQDQFLSFIPGATHDLTRFKGEDSSASDEAIAAAETRKLLRHSRRNGIVEINLSQMADIQSAILRHSKAPDWLFDPTKRNVKPPKRADRLYLALFEADHVEANGPYLVARRSQFVGGTRMQPGETPADHGDLYKKGYRPGDELKVVAMEGIIRQTLRNPKTMQPDALKPVLDPLYAVQEAYFTGNVKALGVTLESLAEEIYDQNMAKGNRNITNAPQNPDELVKRFSETTGITNQTIDQAPASLADASMEAIEFFSSQPDTNLLDLIRTWRPKTDQGAQWHDQMLDYIEGHWVKRLQAA